MREEKILVAGYGENLDEPVFHVISGPYEDRRHLSYEERWNTPSKLETKADEWAKENLKAYTTEEYRSYSTYVLSYDGVEDEELYIEYDDYSDRLMEYAAEHNKKYMFLYDSYTDKFEKIDLPNWNDRDKVSSKEEAIKYLARAISMSFPRFNNTRTDEMKEFSRKWSIPFEIDLLVEAGNYFDNYDCASWDSSSKYC